MEDLAWLILLPPVSKETVGFVDFEFDLSVFPRLPADEAYMKGWNDAKAIAAKLHVDEVFLPE